MEVTLDKWQKWVSALIEGDDCVVANLNSAADDLERNIKLQNEGKWGTEEGPRACLIVCVSVFCLKGLMHDE